MARQPRLDLAQIPQHIVQRGNDRQPRFFNDIDHVRYLHELREIALRERCAVHALGPDRFRLAIEAKLSRARDPPRLVVRISQPRLTKVHSAPCCGHIFFY